MNIKLDNYNHDHFNYGISVYLLHVRYMLLCICSINIMQNYFVNPWNFSMNIYLSNLQFFLVLYFATYNTIYVCTVICNSVLLYVNLAIKTIKTKQTIYVKLFPLHLFTGTDDRTTKTKTTQGISSFCSHSSTYDAKYVMEQAGLRMFVPHYVVKTLFYANRILFCQSVYMNSCYY